MNYEKLYSGEHLKKINPKWTFKKWSYRPTFEAKMKYITSVLSKVPKNKKILDAGCGQGLLVEFLKRRGHDVIGIDAFYGSENVVKKDIFDNGFKENTFDLILCLDVIEHFPFSEQEKLVVELTRILKPGGVIIWSIPNMAHLSSRIAFLFLGRLLRTAKVSYHPGDRPIGEYYRMIRRHLKIVKKKGLSPTIPVAFQMVQLFPHLTGWLYCLLKPFGVFSNWCFNVVVVGKKAK